MGKTYWYCPYCGEEVDPQNVTYQEMHEDCGHPVTLIDDSLQTYKQLQAENARLREALKIIDEWNRRPDIQEFIRITLKEGNDEI